VTKKPIEVRMGKGKGKVDHWMTRVKTGTVLYTIKIENKMLIETVWKLVESKLPIKTGLKKGKELEKA
jgi:large subunit ribosomal protein L16